MSTTVACRENTCCRRSIDSLERLGTDYIDLYQIHRYDPDDADG